MYCGRFLKINTVPPFALKIRAGTIRATPSFMTLTKDGPAAIRNAQISQSF